MRTVTFAWMTALTIGLAVMLWLQLRAPETVVVTGASAELPKTARFDSIDVHRVNVIEPDGKPRVIISSSKHAPGIIWRGEEYPHPGRVSGGLLFYNSDGTEAGGIAYSNDAEDRSAGAIMTFDQYDQDQTLVLKYEEAGGRRGAGLMVFDRPERSLLPMLQAYRDVTRASAAEKPALEAKLAEISGRLGDSALRVFVGKEQDDAVLALSDKQGRPRIVLKVAGDGTPTVELLDAGGKVVKRL